MFIIKTDIELLEDKTRLLKEYAKLKQECAKFEEICKENTDIWRGTKDPFVKRIAYECMQEARAYIRDTKDRASKVYNNIRMIDNILNSESSNSVIGSIYDCDYSGKLNYDRIGLNGIGGVRL